jgi:hypothetical protein
MIILEQYDIGLYSCHSYSRNAFYHGRTSGNVYGVLVIERHFFDRSGVIPYSLIFPASLLRKRRIPQLNSVPIICRQKSYISSLPGRE